MQAEVSGHRVIMLVDTPTPDAMYADLALMVRQEQEDGETWERALVGIVAEDGELVGRAAVVTPLAKPAQQPRRADVTAIPAEALPLLTKALRNKPRGLLVLGSTVIEEHCAVDMLVGVLALTESCGPVARIKARNRGTPAKDMMVPDAIKVLPTLPSVQSAYAQGYRRMIVQPSYTNAELMLEYADDVLFLMGTHGLEAGEIYLNACRAGFGKAEELLPYVVATVGVANVPAKEGNVRIVDVYAPKSVDQPPANCEEMMTFIKSHRTLRWQDGLSALLNQKRVSLAAVRKALGRQSGVSEFLATRGRGPMRSLPGEECLR